MNGDELKRLREAWNEVPEPDERARSTTRARLEAAIAGGASGRWRRLSRRPQTLLAAALLLGLLGAVPALSGNGYDGVIDWLAGKPSEPIVEHLERLDQGAPRGMKQNPIVAKTGLVYKRETEYGELRIWLTPTKGGGRLCQSFEGPRADGKTVHFSGGCFPAELRRPIEVGGSGGGTDFAAGFLNGRVAPGIARLELRYMSGGAEEVPIQNGFFAAAIDPLRMQRLTDHPRELVGLDAGGDIVAREPIDNFYRRGGELAMAPPIAETDRERPAIHATLPGGAQATLFLSPSRAGGHCDRVAVEGTNWSWNCADPAELSQPLRFAAKRPGISGPDGAAAILFGVVRANLTLAFHYEDGDVDQIPLVEQRFLVSLPKERWEPGHRLARIVVSDGERVVLEVPMATKDESFYSGTPDRVPQRPMMQIFNPTELPVVARLGFAGSHGERLELLVRLETPTHWYEVLSVDGKVVSGSNLQWFQGGKDAIISVGWQPMQAPEFDVPKPISLFMGSIRAPAVAARVVYTHGESEAVEVATPAKPVGGGIAGWFLYEMTPARRSEQPLRFEAVDAAGKVVGRQALPRGA